MLKRTIIFAALAGLAFTVNIPAPAYAAVICADHSHIGTGRGGSESQAMKLARTRWYSVARADGHPSSGPLSRLSWSQAKKRKLTCAKPTFGVAYLFYCKATAIPCHTPPNTGNTGTGGDKEVVLGGVNLTPWCAKQFGGGFKAKLIGKTAGDWVCERSAGDRRPILVSKACKLQYGNKAYKAKALNWQDPYSWKCLGK